VLPRGARRRSPGAYAKPPSPTLSDSPSLPPPRSPSPSLQLQSLARRGQSHAAARPGASRRWWGRGDGGGTGHPRPAAERRQTTRRSRRSGSSSAAR
jgi:hypothetical protein